MSRIRSAYRRRTNYRVVLDLSVRAEPRQFTLQPVAPYGHRLVIDLFPADGGRRETVPAPTPLEPDTLRDVVVAIDAGHGGEDPGAVGVGRIYEKRVVLAIAEQIKSSLGAMGGLARRTHAHRRLLRAVA